MTRAEAGRGPGEKSQPYQLCMTRAEAGSGPFGCPLNFAEKSQVQSATHLLCITPAR